MEYRSEAIVPIPFGQRVIQVRVNRVAVRVQRVGVRVGPFGPVARKNTKGVSVIHLPGQRLRFD